MQRPSDQVIQDIRTKYGSYIEFELPEFDFMAVLRPFDAQSCQRFVDEGVISIDDASDRLLVRHVLWPAPAEVQAMKRRCAKLSKRVADALTEDAGLPVTPPAMKSTDRLTSSTPPGVLAQAGLDEAKAAELIASHPGVRLVIVTITDASCAVIFACVLSSPGDTELGLLRDARDRQKGYAAAALSASQSCVAWSREDTDQAFNRYPAIPALVLPGEINDLGGGDAVKRFRRRQ